MFQWLKHAFAVESNQPVQPNDRQQAIVERISQEVVKRHLTTPALMMLEMSRPLNYVGSQGLHFFMPMLSAITDASGIEEFARFLEQRGSIDYISDRLEHWEATAVRREKGVKE